MTPFAADTPCSGTPGRPGDQARSETASCSSTWIGKQIGRSRLSGSWRGARLKRRQERTERSLGRKAFRRHAPHMDKITFSSLGYAMR